MKRPIQNDVGSNNIDNDDANHKRAKQNPPHHNLQDLVAKAKQKAAQILSSVKSGQSTSGAASASGSADKPQTNAPPSVALAKKPSSFDIIRQQIAAKKEQLQHQVQMKSTASASTQPSRGSSSGFISIRSDMDNKARGGLNIESHPLLSMDLSQTLKSSRSKSLLPKPMYTTVRANQRIQEESVPPKPKQITKKSYMTDRDVTAEFRDTSKNPYFDPSLKSSSSIGPRMRKPRALEFVPHGKYIDQAEKLRHKAELDAIQAQINENAIKLGSEKEIELVSDACLRTVQPPAVEWWDAKLVPDGKSYESLVDSTGISSAEFGDGNALITDLVQHPVPIDALDDSGAPAPRPIMLTRREQKKLRRQRREAERKERQEKIRLGLLPPDQPKVKLSNLMRVLGQEAVLNPTQVEAQVREQMAARKQKHRDLVNSMKLTPAQRAEKLRSKLTEDVSAGIHVAVFRVRNLSHKQIRFKVNVNAQQYQLSGAAIVHPALSVVVVEGGPKGIKAYKKLMLRRIDWNLKDASVTVDASTSASADPSSSPQEEELSNECILVWEGQVKERAFKGFQFKSLPTDSMAKEFLKKLGVVSYWDIARNYSTKNKI